MKHILFAQGGRGRGGAEDIPQEEEEEEEEQEEEEEEATEEEEDPCVERYNINKVGR